MFLTVRSGPVFHRTGHTDFKRRKTEGKGGRMLRKSGRIKPALVIEEKQKEKQNGTLGNFGRGKHRSPLLQSA